MLALAAMGYRSLNLASHSTEDLHRLVTKSSQISSLLTNVQNGFVTTLNRIANGTITWVEGAKTVEASQQQFNRQWQAIVNDTDGDIISLQLKNSIEGVSQAYTQFLNITQDQSRATLELFVLNDLTPLVNPFLEASELYGSMVTEQSETAFSLFETTFDNSVIQDVILILVTAVVTSLVGYLTYRSILLPVRQIETTIREVQDNANARTGLTACRDELATLGNTLDDMLDEKNATLQHIETENENINNSVIELLEGTSQLSDRDLTVRLKVREDVTGPVADAMNMATLEIGEALAKIRQISDMISLASGVIDAQSNQVTRVSKQEALLVKGTIEKLQAVSRKMMQIAKWSQASNQIAKRATKSTDSAFDSVSNTINSMEEIRHSISETEKRIKRLSERSQEISSIIDIINSIAERTHVLALNASMQAAAAGEAGRGFAVVADEVQRLAESSRDSTNQIAVLVRNIQTETAAAVDTMNNSISEVVAGSKLAQLAGDQMRETQLTTKNLAQAVAKISEQSILQAKETDQLKAQSNQIQQSSEKTNLELKRQAEQTQRLASASKMLTATISVFSIPKALLTKNLAAQLMQQQGNSASIVHLEKRDKGEDGPTTIQAIG
ncbi:MAG: methyl-accepting chemotaxis protein [Reinekea sp.]